MKKLIFSLFVALISTVFISKANHTIVAVNGNINVEADFLKFLGTKIKYPEKARAKDLQGNSIISFKVTSGKLSDIKIEAELGEGCDVEVLNNILAYPNLKTIKNGSYALKTAFLLDGSYAAVKNDDAMIPEGFKALNLVVVAMPVAKANTINLSYKTDKTWKTFNVRNTGTGITIRGKENGLNPMVILDSTEIEHSELQSILPEDIESMQIYRGDSAILQYGPSAVNGVIVITTKKKPTIQPKKAPEQKTN